MEEEKDMSLFALSGLKAAFEEVDRMKEEERKKKEEEFWEESNDIDPFWLT